MANRKQRRQQRRLKGKLPGETLVEALTRKQKQLEIFRDAVKDHSLEDKAEVRTRRAIWLCVLAMKRAFDTTPEQFLEFSEALRVEVSQYEKRKRPGFGDDVYANEMLRREASACIGGEVGPLYDEEMLEAVEQMANTRTHGDQIRAMTDEELAVELLKYWRLTVDKDGFEDLSVHWCSADCPEDECDEDLHLACIRDWLRSPVKQEAKDGT